ncbi:MULTISPECIES: hypothetical protein [unclassified Nonomuraea]|nr:hypothetical protein [Nonomuraea sp. 3-1Str]
MPTQTVEVPQFTLAANATPAVTTDAQHERAWYPPFASPRAE